jgi:hypothetical protein
MSSFRTEGYGKIVFVNDKPIQDDLNVTTYLLQSIGEFGDKKVKSSIKVVDFRKPSHRLYEVGQYIQVTGLLKENKYKNKKGEWVSTGLEVVHALITEISEEAIEAWEHPESTIPHDRPEGKTPDDCPF